MSCLYSKQTLLGKEREETQISNVIVAKRQNNKMNWPRSFVYCYWYLQNLLADICAKLHAMSLPVLNAFKWHFRTNWSLNCRSITS